MDALLSPTPMDPARALVETIEALDEQLQTRVRSVSNGEEYVAGHPGVIPMPRGAAVFETTGPWEDYATPSRDLRILIAIDVVKGFPERAARRPERYALLAGRAPAEIRAELERLLADEIARRRLVYRRSDGSEWTLTLAGVDAHARRRPGAHGGARGCVQPERLRRNPLGRAAGKRRERHLSPPGAARPGRPHGGVPRVVPRAPASAARVAAGSSFVSAPS
ncbi:MAG: hypothetical protein E6J79_13555 [Deltaproteobacteria bacterium]|nr:MAG: hypothetical protein E6J79_13555 [Deltaproteobacteria bacterium]